MNDKLRDAIDYLQTQLDGRRELLTGEFEEELQIVLEAAWAYWELLD